MAAETEDLLREIDNLRNSFNGLSGSASSAASASTALESGLKGLKTASKTATDSLTKGLSGFTSSVAQGNTGLAQFNQIVGAATTAVGAVGDAAKEAGTSMMGARNIFANVLGGAAIGLGVTLNGLAKATAAASGVILSQSDNLAKAYTDLGKMGGLTAEGMTGLSRQVTNSGLSLDQFRNVIAENSAGLAAFKGTVGEGATALFDVTGQLSKSYQEINGKIVPVNQEFADLQGQLRYMGFGAEQIAETAAGFVKNQTLLGRQNLITQDSLRKSTVDYAVELDTVAKLTGANRKEIQKNQEAALRESRYAANLEITRRQFGDSTANLVDDVQRLLSNIPGMEDTAKGFRDTLGGLNTELGRQASRSVGANTVINKIRSGEIKTREQALEELQQNAARTAESNRNLAGTATDVAEKVYGNYAAINAFSKMPFKAGQALVKGSQQAAKDGLDPLTKSVTSAQQAMEFLNTQLFKLSLDFVPLASDAVQEFAKAAGVAAAEIRQQFGGATTTTPGAGPAQKRAEEESIQARMEVERAKKDRDEKIKAAKESGASPAEINKIRDAADAKVDAAQKEYSKKFDASLKEAGRAARASQPTTAEASKLANINSKIKDSYSEAEDLKSKLESVKTVTESAAMKANPNSKEALEWKKKQADLEEKIAKNEQETLALQEQYKTAQKEIQESINKRKEALQKETTPVGANKPVTPIPIDVENPFIATQPLGTQPAGAAPVRGPTQPAATPVVPVRQPTQPPKTPVVPVRQPTQPPTTPADNTVQPKSRSIMFGQKPGAGTVPGNDLFGLGGLAGPSVAPAAPGTVNISDLLDFNPGQYGTGDLAHFGRLESGIKNAVIEAAKQYKSNTGNKLQVNGGWRDFEDQKKLYLDYINGRSRYPAAKPGTSDHEAGMAVDIGTLNPMAINALNTQGLFQRVPGDQVHFTKEFGGVVSGPRSGYQGVLHGTEAVVPLAGGRNIPVEMPRLNNALEEQASLMKSMIAVFNDVLDVLKTGNRTSRNILQITRN